MAASAQSYIKLGSLFVNRTVLVTTLRLDANNTPEPTHNVATSHVLINLLLTYHLRDFMQICFRMRADKMRHYAAYCAAQNRWECRILRFPSVTKQFVLYILRLWQAELTFIRK